MSATEILEQIRRLPEKERREVVQQIWNEFAEFDDALSPEQIAELDRRAEEALKHAERGIPWQEVRDDVLKQLKK